MEGKLRDLEWKEFDWKTGLNLPRSIRWEWEKNFSERLLGWGCRECKRKHLM